LERLREDVREYEVEEIIAQKRVKYCKGTRLLYQCQWKGYGITEDWIPEKYLQNTKEILNSWKIEVKNKKLQK